MRFVDKVLPTKHFAAFSKNESIFDFETLRSLENEDIFNLKLLEMFRNNVSTQFPTENYREFPKK